MSELDDHDLLMRYARNNSEAAFATLVQRYVSLVYSVAMRSVGNPHAAEEITQAVFIILAQKASRISPNTILPGWLHQTTRLTAANFLRGEIRRQKREQEAYMQSTLNQHDVDVWPKIAPLLDEALGKLGERDRDALVLRFFGNKSLREVGDAMGTGEDAAKMRVNRALEKLRKIFTKRSVTFSVTAIAGAVSANSIRAAPVGLSKVATSVALAKGAAASTSTLTIVKGALKIMAWTKAKTAIGITVAIILAAGTTTVAVRTNILSRQQDIYEDIFKHPNSSSMRKLEQAPPILIVRPTKHPNLDGGIWDGGGKGFYVGAEFSDLLTWAYGVDTTRVILPTEAPTNSYDYLDTLPGHHQEALRDRIKSQFGLVAHREVRPMDVLLLTTEDTSRLDSFRTKGRPFACYGTGDGNTQTRCFTNAPLELLAEQIVEGYFQKPCIDQTTQNIKYDFTLQWREQDGLSKGARLQTLRPVMEAQLTQLGLKLVPTNMPIEVLVVEKEK